MPAKDLRLTIAASIVTSVFLLPTLLNTNFFDKIPFGWIALLLVFPIVCVLGMHMAYFMGKKLSILWQVAKFGFVGVLNTAIDFGILNALIALTSITSGFGIIVLNAISFSCAVINSFFWNRQWVFANGKKSHSGNFLTFLTVTLIGMSINSGVVYALTTFYTPTAGINPTQWANMAKILATCLSLVWNFMGYKVVVFRK